MKLRSTLKFRRQKNGVTRIVRDSYHAAGTKGWYDTVKKIDKRDGGVCQKCGRVAAHLHTHHIRPLSKGGTTTKRNLMKVCDVCHERLHPGNQHLQAYNKERRK